MGKDKMAFPAKIRLSFYDFSKLWVVNPIKNCRQ